MQVYDQPVHVTDLHQMFDKWAAVQASDFNDLPTEMESFILSAGLYAIFQYKGLSTDTCIFQYIFGTWLQILVTF